MSRTVLEMFIKKEQKANKIFKMHKTAYLLFCLGTAENRRLLGWEFELSYTSEDDTGKYELKLNDCRVDRLEKAQGLGREEPPLSK